MCFRGKEKGPGQPAISLKLVPENPWRSVNRITLRAKSYHIAKLPPKEKKKMGMRIRYLRRRTRLPSQNTRRRGKVVERKKNAAAPKGRGGRLTVRIAQRDLKTRGGDVITGAEDGDRPSGMLNKRELRGSREERESVLLCWGGTVIAVVSCAGGDTKPFGPKRENQRGGARRGVRLRSEVVRSARGVMSSNWIWRPAAHSRKGGDGRTSNGNSGLGKRSGGCHASWQEAPQS